MEQSVEHTDRPVRSVTDSSGRHKSNTNSLPETVSGNIVIPVVAEEPAIDKRVVETGRTRISKKVTEHEEVVDVPILSEEVQVERKQINRVCEGPAPTVRQDGDTTIIPVLEEVLVVEKRLMLKEELHITRKRHETHEPQRVNLRREEVSVDRVKPGGR